MLSLIRVSFLLLNIFTMRDNGWEATFEKEYGTDPKRSNWGDTIRKEYDKPDIKPLPDRHNAPCHPHNPQPPKNDISLFDFIDNGKHDTIVGPPIIAPTSDTFYGPWVKDGITYLSIGYKGVWKHIEIYSSIPTPIAEGVYGSGTEIPVLHFNDEGLIIGVTTENITFSIDNLPDSGVTAGSYGSVSGDTITIPEITVNSKGVITEVVDRSIDLTSKLDKNFVFDQSTPSATWNIVHNLNKYPSVTVIDSANNMVIGEVHYPSINEVVIIFSGGFSGKAFLN